MKMYVVITTYIIVAESNFMINYFIKDGYAEIGPFSFTQLKSRSIKKDTLIWRAGLEDWIAATDIFELQELFIEKPSRAVLPIYKFIKNGKRN